MAEYKTAVTIIINYKNIVHVCIFKLKRIKLSWILFNIVYTIYFLRILLHYFKLDM